MKPARSCALKITHLFAWALALAASPASLQAADPFDYFQNSWQVIGLKDYKDGTRVTPQNELVLAGNRKLRISVGPARAPLSRRQTKTLLEGWLPVVLLNAEESAVRYEFTLWATPLPTVKDWKAACDGPVEGENFLNWVRVRARNLTSGQVEARVRFDLVTTNASNPTEWSARLAPGRSAETVFRVPFAPTANATALEQESANRWLGRTVQYWRGLLAQGARIEVPCEKATQTLKAAHVCQLIASDHGELHAGEGFYDEFYIRDGGYQILELEEAGLWDAARHGIEVYLRYQRPDGRFESQANQLDANGQALWTLWQYWKITADKDWLRKAYPQMRRAAEWIKNARRQTPADSPFPGLLPAGVADGEFLWDGKHHIVGYDLWNLRGLLCAADAARALGTQADAEDFEREAEDYRKAIDAAGKRAGLSHFPPSWEKVGTPWGNTETLWPTELFALDDPRVTATLTEVREKHGGGFVEGTIRWTGQPNVIHPYLSSYTTMASLLRGEHEKFAEEFYWYLLHSSASHAFPEGVYFKRRYAWGETIPHVLGAANFAFMLRHALIHERGNELHLLLGAPDWWLADGKEIRVENAPTHFGPMSLRVRGTAKGVKVQLDPPRREAPKRIVLHLPQSRPAVSAPKGVELAARSDQSRRWDFPSVVEMYERQAAAPPKPIPGLVALPMAAALSAGECRMLDLAPAANTDPFSAPFGVPRPGKYLFTGLRTGVQNIGGVPFRITDAATNQGRGLVVLQGAGASAAFPREIEVPVRDQGQRLFFLGNVHGYSPDDEGAGDWGAVAEYVIHYADGQTQTVPLISHRTADDWAMEPDAREVFSVLKGEPWHLNVLGVVLRPVTVEKVTFRDLGTPAAPVLAAVTLQK
jgi:hypothetical protein